MGVLAVSIARVETSTTYQRWVHNSSAVYTRFERHTKEAAFNLDNISESGAPASPAAAGGRGRPPKTPTNPNGKDRPIISGASSDDDDGNNAEDRDRKHEKPLIKKV